MTKIIRTLLFFFLFITVMSCSESIYDMPLNDKEWVDSIVVRNNTVLDFATNDTLCLDVIIYPHAVELSSTMITEHRLFLNISEDKDNAEPVAYKITKVDKGSEGAFLVYIADIKAGYGYKDSVQICYRNNSSIVKSSPFEVKNAGTSLLSFSLTDGVTTWDSFDVRNDTISVQVPQSFDLTRSTAIFAHNGASVYLNNMLQHSGDGIHDFTDFCNPPEYIVKGFEGEEKKYTIQLFNLPIIYVNTPDSVAVTSREEWVGNSTFTIRDTYGTVEDYGEASIKGRGNWTWRYGVTTGKKPYVVKLANKPKDREVLGMPGHKRWVLLSNPYSYLPNPVGFEVNRRTESCSWAPRCRFVELILNGKLEGLYLLCEQIRVDKNRVNIKEMKKSDVDGEALTGGYLLSFDDAYEDDDPTYYSEYLKMPFMIKNPDTDDIQPSQLKYITDYINEAELSLVDEGKFRNKEFYNYFDIDSWIDYFFVAELWGANEIKRPRSIWLYKDRGGKLTAGPIWDLESNYFHQQELFCTEALYYGRLFKSDDVLNRMKNKWRVFRSNIIGNEKYGSIIDYIDSIYKECHYSADRDRKRTPPYPNYHLKDPNGPIEEEYQVIRDNILVKLDWLENQILSW